MRWDDPERISQKTYESVNRRGSGSSVVYVIVHRSSRRKRLFFLFAGMEEKPTCRNERSRCRGKGRQFRADLWLDEKITGRTLDVLRRQGVRFPEGVNPRKTAAFKEEYQRQLAKFRRKRTAQNRPSRPQSQHPNRPPRPSNPGSDTNSGAGAIPYPRRSGVHISNI